MDVEKKNIKIRLLKDERPMLMLGLPKGDIKCLIDTGAQISVWCSDEVTLKNYFNAEKTNYVTLIGGFGQGADLAEMWRIPEFRLVDSESGEAFVIKGLLIAVLPRTIFEFSLILGAPIFRKTKYTFDYLKEDNDQGVMEIICEREYGSMPVVHDWKKGDFPEDEQKQIMDKGTLIDTVKVLALEAF